MLDVSGLATLYVWYPHQGADGQINVGHSSVLTDLGEYESFWPSGDWKTLAEGEFNRHFRDDVRSEGRQPDEVIYIIYKVPTRNY